MKQLFCASLLVISGNLMAQTCQERLNQSAWPIRFEKVLDCTLLDIELGAPQITHDKLCYGIYKDASHNFKSTTFKSVRYFAHRSDSFTDSVTLLANGGTYPRTSVRTRGHNIVTTVERTSRENGNGEHTLTLIQANLQKNLVTITDKKRKNFSFSEFRKATYRCN